MILLFSRALFLTGLALVGIGTGGIKPCVATFGGEQVPPSFCADFDLDLAVRDAPAEEAV